jgi:dTMP kinase
MPAQAGIHDLSSGRFVTLEGGEGAGKSTQAKLLADALAARGIPVLCTREPGGAPGAEILRGLLLDPAMDWSRRAETFLHFAARAEHVEKTIRPALAAGMWVICDRFTDSTRAYQGFGLGVDRVLIESLATQIGLDPDLTLVLDVSEETARARLASRGLPPDRYEAQAADFHTRIRAGFRTIAAEHPTRCHLIDATGTLAEVHTAILATTDIAACSLQRHGRS